MVCSRRSAYVTAATAACTAALLLLPGNPIVAGQSSPQTRDTNRRQRFTHDNLVDAEFSAARTPVSEAPAGFRNETNGFSVQGPPFATLTSATVVAGRSFNDNRFIFEEVETIEDGLGPTYNAQSCRECHQNVVTGGASQVTVQRAGHLLNGQFFESQGGSLIHSRGTSPDAAERVSTGDDIRAFRISPGTLGDGFVEAIANDTLTRIRDNQPAALRGNAAIVPVLEANGRGRIGRFGWKSQHASLESFAVDAYLNEMGITTPLLMDENTVGGKDVAWLDHVPDPEDDGDDARAFAGFMRATMAPPRGTITATVLAGEQVFARTGCHTCHVGAIVTAPPGTAINGGAMIVPASLGNKIIHPYSDFLLHNVGTGDGIPIQPTAEYATTANQIRTAPLWGLRTRNRLMHDGLSFTLEEAILRHAGQATQVTRRYQALTTAEKVALIAFLDSM